MESAIDMAEFEQVAVAGELQSGDRKSVIIDETPALLIRVQDEFFVIEDVCSHDGQPLTDGPINGCEITCPRHGARFDVRTGQVLCMPATEPIKTFEVEVKEGVIFARPRH